MNIYQKNLNDIHLNLSNLVKECKRIFVSSSFQTHSIPLLHIVSQYDKNIPIYFIDTGFHFPETLLFRDKISELLDLNLINIESPINKSDQKDSSGKFHFCSNSDYCCHINKILPLEPVLQINDIWITGVRRDQNANRKSMTSFASGAFDTTRYHPMLEWTSKMIWAYRKDYHLPFHPLEEKGYLSVGCAPCTQKYDESQRGARWKGQSKDECGLHTDLLN